MFCDQTCVVHKVRFAAQRAIALKVAKTSFSITMVKQLIRDDGKGIEALVASNAWYQPSGIGDQTITQVQCRTIKNGATKQGETIKKLVNWTKRGS